jgi:uncharacterized protein (DUF58 family)
VPSPEQLLRRAELAVARRLDGVLQGERRGRRPGPGDEPSITRAYEPGDDVRWVDWPLSARAGEPMVRVPEIQPVLTAWVLVDRSASMAFGSAFRTKADVAQEVVAGIGSVLRRRGDRLGVVATRGGTLDLIRPPRGDRRALIEALAATGAVVPRMGGGVTNLAAAVTALGRIARHRGLVAIISDFPSEPSLERAIGVLGRRHEVLAIEVRDLRERELPSIGPVRLRDMETGRQQVVDTADPRFRERFQTEVARAAAARRAMLQRAGARHVEIRPEGDWVTPLIAGLQRPAPRRRTA